MDKRLARYITCLIANDYDKKSEGCISSYECELLEKKFIEGRFEQIEQWLVNRLWSKKG